MELLDLLRIGAALAGGMLGGWLFAHRRAWTITLDREPLPGGIRGVQTHAGRKVPQVVHQLTDALAVYARENPNSPDVRVIVQVRP